MRPIRPTAHHLRRCALIAAILASAACTSDPATSASPSGSDAEGSTETTAHSESSLWDESSVHTISVEFDDADYAQLLADYIDGEDKTWIEATVTIDGETYEQVGLRLKGNSSLRQVSSTAAAEGLPWLIDLNQFVEGQQHDGVDELVIRSNGSETALNEAVALDLLEAAGLSSQHAISTAFSVNGSDPVLRLAIENPDGAWVDNWFGTDGSLYKAESTGDYSYRGDDAAAYEDVFDLEAGDDESLSHLTDFLQFVNESDDATFAAELGDHLDVEAFATYLAMMEVVGNFDDIDGPGNNSYLYYDPETGLMSVVPWDMNLALGVGMAGGGGGGGAPAGGGGPGGGFPDGGSPGGEFPGGGPGGGGPGGGRGGANQLVERFLAVDEFVAAYDEARASLQAELIDSGLAEELLAARTEVLISEASDLIDSATVTSEAADVRSAL